MAPHTQKAFVRARRRITQAPELSTIAEPLNPRGRATDLQPDPPRSDEARIIPLQVRFRQGHQVRDVVLRVSSLQTAITMGKKAATRHPPPASTGNREVMLAIGGNPGGVPRSDGLALPTRPPRVHSTAVGSLLAALLSRAPAAYSPCRSTPRGRRSAVPGLLASPNT